MTTVRLLLYFAAFGMLMTAAATPPYWQPDFWHDAAPSFRWTIAASQLLYLLAGMLIGATTIGPLFTSRRQGKVG